MFLVVALSFFAIGTWSVDADAFPITYIFEGTGVSGVFNDTEFNAGSFKVAIFGDTNNATTDALGPINSNMPGTITLVAPEIGFNSGSFLDPLFVFVDPALELVGFGSDVLDSDLLDMFAPGQGLTTYDLKSFFGPIPGSLTFAADMDLNIGLLSIEDAGALTFAAVPEPGTLLLLGIGLVGIVGCRRKIK